MKHVCKQLACLHGQVLAAAPHKDGEQRNKEPPFVGTERHAWGGLWSSMCVCMAKALQCTNANERATEA
jgi:hypothetical protein